MFDYLAPAFFISVGFTRIEPAPSGDIGWKARMGGCGQLVAQAQRRVKRFLHGRCNAGEVAHLPAAPGLGFAVEVQRGCRIRKQGLPPWHSAVPQVFKQGVLHYHRTSHCVVAQRQAGKRSDLLLELRRLRRVERAVAVVVRPRCEFIDEEPAVFVNEEFHA